MIISRGMGYLSGQTVKYIKANGKMGDSMEEECM